eukprot:4988179-Pyramimonas_sp.AAC.1
MPRHFSQRLEIQRQRRSIRAQCHFYLRGAAAVDCAALEEEDKGGERAELHLHLGAREAFLGCGEEPPD